MPHPTSQPAPFAIAAAISGLMLVLPSLLLWGAVAAGATRPNVTSALCAPLPAGELAASPRQSNALIVGTALGERRALDYSARIYVSSDDDENDDDSNNTDDSDDPDAADWQVTPTEVVEA